LAVYLEKFIGFEKGHILAVDKDAKLDFATFSSIVGLSILSIYYDYDGAMSTRKTKKNI
jgi:hypothetical protein